jgi:orotate phosphoribosyltransferase
MLNNSANLLEEFIGLIRNLSYQKRDVKLASGKKSDFYVDMKNTLLHPRGIWLASHLIAAQIQSQNDKGANIKGVGGLTMGADPLSTGVSLVSSGWSFPLFAFYIRKEPKSHGTQEWLEGLKNFKSGDKVIILEDVVTTGGSTLKSIERAKLSGLEVKGVITAVDRQEGGQENIMKKNIPFYALVTKEMILK